MVTNLHRLKQKIAQGYTIDALLQSGLLRKKKGGIAKWNENEAEVEWHELARTGKRGAQQAERKKKKLKLSYVA